MIHFGHVLLFYYSVKIKYPNIGVLCESGTEDGFLYVSGRIRCFMDRWQSNRMGPRERERVRLLTVCV